jgi:hypothetical protein
MQICNFWKLGKGKKAVLHEHRIVSGTDTAV